MTELIQYALSGGAAGAANGLFGAGGGMLLVPLLTGWAGLREKAAFATGLAVILPICLTSLGVYAQNGALAIQDALPYLAGGFLGGLLGGTLFRRISGGLLRRALGLMLLYGGVRMLLG